MLVVDNANRAILASWQMASQPYIAASRARSERYLAALRSLAQAFQASGGCTRICEADSVGFSCWLCWRDNQNRIDREANAIAGPLPVPPPLPQLQTYPACSSPNCPPGKKVWTQVLWASPSDNFTDFKGCYIVAYSQDAPTLPVKVEYNPFLPDIFVKSRALSYYLVHGDKYRGLQDNEWSNLESVSGWDKGYWRSEFTDSECRGWRPGWSRPVK
jgi:hypothetical protein